MKKKALWTQLPNCAQHPHVSPPLRRKGSGGVRVWSRRSKSPKSKLGACLRPRTAKRAAEEAVYRRRVTFWLRQSENRLCRGCRPIFNRDPNRTTECHHYAGRRGVLLLFEPWWIPLCAECHQWVTNNAKAASWLNLMCNPGWYNDPPPAEALAAFERSQLRKQTNGQK